ncbi:MAG: pseudouridine-5'-phosphate glycosidase [Clostridia bacterium]|nr:pseudouridine-5'-phosphate glycosidase [Clostridia bacterium]
MKIRISTKVSEAIKNGDPVVSLESTIISHGMPYPQNVQTALEVEKIICDNGALPATIAIIKGEAVIGATAEDIEYLGKKGSGVTKCGCRDIPVVLARGGDGATTVSGTIILSKKAGIDIFATGGIGGVHRMAFKTFDISRDLKELGSNNIAVVCAGAKSILDLNLTMEYLETEGVTVIGYQTDEFPAFYTGKSGIKLEVRMDAPIDVAQVLQTKKEMQSTVGTLVAVPIPKAYEMDATEINQAIDAALADMNVLGIAGKKVTPFLLDRVKQLTGGKSLDANIALVKNNAKVAAQIAVEYSKSGKH